MGDSEQIKKKKQKTLKTLHDCDPKKYVFNISPVSGNRDVLSLTCF